MRNYGRNTAYAMVGIALAAGLYTAWEHVRPILIDMCNAGFGGCQ